jgi:hypothetical protein
MAYNELRQLCNFGVYAAINMQTRCRRLIIALMFSLTLGLGVLIPSSLPVKAQSTGDTLPTRTPTSHPTSTPRPTATSTATPVRLVWVGRVVDNLLGFTKGEGSIFRVHVQGIAGTPIELRSDNQLIVANSGSKKEYGLYAAEFAPVTKGVWNVSVPALGVSLDVVADNYNLAVIEFVHVPVVEATQTVLPSPTATPLGGTHWQGRLTGESIGAGVPFSRLLVRVVGLDNHPVRLSTLAQVINTANTGQKPNELGPNTVEFTGLTPGKYIVEPEGLNVGLEVELKPNVETRVEFAPLPATATAMPTATATPTPVYLTATPTASPTFSPTPTATATPSPTPVPTPTATPSPIPTSVTRWLGVIAQRNPAVTYSNSLLVKITGIEGISVRLHAFGSAYSDRRCITGQEGLGQDVCQFKGLPPGQYVISPEGMGLSLPITLYEQETVQVIFDLEVLPPGITGWQAELVNNGSGSLAQSRTVSIIRVRLVGRQGQVVVLRPARIPAAEQFCEVIYNPIRGGLICEFGQLGPGVYTVEALNTGAYIKVFVDGVGQAEVKFSPSAAYALLTQPQPVVGQGAQPRQPTATATPIPLVLAPPTATATPMPTATLTPAFAWQARVVESTYIGSGSIGVRAAGLKEHPVVLRSGDWQSPPQLTGSKVELGEYATEFGGLAPGEYIVELVDLAQLKVSLLPGEFMLVEFRYDFVTPP